MVGQNFYKFIKYYGHGRKIKLFGFLVLSLIAGGLELLGVALVYPFILMVISPESVTSTVYYSRLSGFLHTKDVMVVALIIGVMVAFLFILKNLFIIYSIYCQNKFVTNWKMDLQNKFIEYYLLSPYKKTLETSPSEKLYRISFLTAQALDGFVFRLINFLTNSIIVLMILALLVFKFPSAAIVTGVFVLISLLLHNKIFKSRTIAISRSLSVESIQNNDNLMEIINNIKELKVLSAENYAINRYEQSQKRFSRVLFLNNFYCSISPYLVEVFVVFAVLILAGVITFQNIENTSWMVAAYGVMVAAIFRIAPALNRIQTSVNAMNSAREIVKVMLNTYEESDITNIEKDSKEVITFKESIKLVDVGFAYKKKKVLNGVNLEIKKGEFVGIVGLSGAGKSTLVDIIMGLLPIEEGFLNIDGEKIDINNAKAARKLFGYVSQQVNILDGSLKRNIAFGIDDNDINSSRVLEVLKLARLEELLDGNCEAIDNNIIKGASGLSQGQKQRLAIARALYRDPEVLILDEATSSLDMETESEITGVLNGFKGEKTIIAIAHRLSTLKSCDRLIFMKSGEIIDSGSFEELAYRNNDFARLVKLSSLENKI